MTGRVDGVRLYEHAGGREWTPIQHDAWKNPWIAYPEPVAVALLAVAEAVADDLDCFASLRVREALDAYRAAQQEAS